MAFKTEREFREAEIQDAVRSEVNLTVSAYRRRLGNAVPGLLAHFRAECEKGTMPAIDEKYRRRIRKAVRTEAANHV